MTPRLTFETAGSSGPPLVLLHGIGGTAASFRPLMEELAERWFCLAWNMPGYGGSEPLAPLTFPALAEALLALLADRGLEQVHLLGHSIGGMVALEFALRFPQRVHSLALLATTAAFGSRDGDFQKRFMAERTAPLDAGLTMAELARALVPTLLGEDVEPQAARLAESCMASIPPSAYRAALACLVGFDRRAALPSLAMPALLIAGERDRLAPATTMRRMAERMPRAEFALMPGAGHLLPLERPRQCAALLSAFLARFPSTGGTP